MHSWRVLILPYVEETDVYDRYDFYEPWNGPNNSKLRLEMPDVFACRSHGHHGDPVGEYVTNYMLITGANTAFLKDHESRMQDFKDGTSKTAIVAEVNRNSVSWMAPIDLPADDFVEMLDEPNHSGNLIMVGYADGHVQALAAELDPDILRALTAIAVGEELDHD